MSKRANRRFIAAQQRHYLKPGRWWHIAAVHDDRGLRTYVNGRRWPVLGMRPGKGHTVAAWIKSDRRMGGAVPIKVANHSLHRQELTDDDVRRLACAGTES